MTSTPTIPEPEVSEVTMHTVCDETMTTYYNPVPGINTILSCAEGKVQIDNGPTPTLTLNVRQKMDQIRQMFFEGESEQQLSVSMGSMSTEVKDSPPLPRPQAPLHIHKDAPEEAPPICKGGLQILRDEPSAPVFVQPEKPKGLKIHKDPELIAVRGDGGDIPRQPLRTVAQIPAPFAPAEQSEASLANSPLSGGPKGDDSVVPTFTLPLVFDPTCASTAVFARPPGKSSVPPHQDCPQVQETADSDVEVRSPSPQPLSPDAPLEDVFNRFVHSPDQSGRLRIDATKFIDAFLTKKATRALGTENQRPPPF
ncbi:unnamed protein product [Mesocestoides corti]|nr:unnamed protein product [Mesocestoides corti]